MNAFPSNLQFIPIRHKSIKKANIIKDDDSVEETILLEKGKEKHFPMLGL